MEEKNNANTCAKGTCDLGTQQNGVNQDYKLKCSECGHEAPQHTKDKICPKCRKGLLYWSYEPDDGLTDYHKRMIAKFYGNLTDVRIRVEK